MSDVIIVGGGLSGLAAAWELEQRGIDYTLIEVKGRLGGSVISETQAGWVLDGGPFILRQSREWAFLEALGLQDAIYDAGKSADGARLVAFKQGTQAFVDALAARIPANRIIYRMSVSSIGQVDAGGFAVCLENGMLLQAAALIIAAPARYAERMFYSFCPAVSQRLLNYRYDTITRVTLGYHKDHIEIPVMPPPDVGFAFGRWTDSEYRVPAGHVLVQVGLRYALLHTTPEAVIKEAQANMNWPDTALVQRVDYWPESHHLAPRKAARAQVMAEIRAELPQGVQLIGSDYDSSNFEDRVTEGLNAGVAAAAWLKG